MGVVGGCGRLKWNTDVEGGCSRRCVRLMPKTGMVKGCGTMCGRWFDSHFRQ